MQDYSDESIEVLTDLQTILKRPGLWTPDGSLDQVLVFIAGYSLGLRDGPREQIEEVKVFYDWLNSILGSAAPYTAQALVKAFGSEDAFFTSAFEVLRNR